MYFDDNTLFSIHLRKIKIDQVLPWNQVKCKIVHIVHFIIHTMCLIRTVNSELLTNSERLKSSYDSTPTLLYPIIGLILCFPIGLVACIFYQLAVEAFNQNNTIKVSLISDIKNWLGSVLSSKCRFLTPINRLIDRWAAI